MDRADYEAVLATVPRRRDQLLPALHTAHAVSGWLPEAAIEAVGRHVFVPLSELYGIVTSYSEFRLTPPNVPAVELCTGLSCRIAGAGGLGATVDKTIAIDRVECRFLCAVAPVAQIGGRYHGRLTPERFASLTMAAKAGAQL